MIRKICVTLVLMLATSISVFAQSADIAILPFTGGSRGDGDTIADMIGGRLFNVVGSKYGILLRGDIGDILKEHKFQRNGLTEENTIKKRGEMANAKYVITGNIEKLGRQNYLVAAMIEVKTLRQTAGAYYIYEDLQDVIEQLEGMARTLIEITEKIDEHAPVLAMFPFDIESRGENNRAAELLTQILSCEIANTREYAVVIRTSEITKVMNEQKIQRSNLASKENVQELGKGFNAKYVLTGKVTSLNRMTTYIRDVETFRVKGYGEEEYSDRTDGVELMSALSYKLTGKISQAKLDDFLKKLNVYRRSGIMSSSEMNTIRALISNGDMNAKNNVGHTALMLTSAWNDTRIDIVKDIIYLGADVNAVANDGTTALMYAAANGFTENVKVLIQNGAKINVKNNNGDTALYLAKEYGRTTTIRVLQEAGAL